MLYFWVTDFVARKLVIDQCLVKKQPAKTRRLKLANNFLFLEPFKLVIDQIFIMFS